MCRGPGNQRVLSEGKFSPGTCCPESADCADSWFGRFSLIFIADLKITSAIIKSSVSFAESSLTLRVLITSEFGFSLCSLHIENPKNITLGICELPNDLSKYFGRGKIAKDARKAVLTNTFMGSC